VAVVNQCLPYCLVGSNLFWPAVRVGDVTMTNEDLEDVEFFNRFAHSGTRWTRDPTCRRYMDLLSLLAMLQNETLRGLTESVGQLVVCESVK
jgi:hypothetical protein